jgi:lipid II:glycine glycyltransferase (peptidoglycan interpeptide bridge formation enzyme)
MEITVETSLNPKNSWALLPTDILFQTVFWGKVKSRLGWNTFAFDINASGPRGDVLVLTKSFGQALSAAYVPQGPEYCPPHEDYGPFLEQLSEALMGYLDKSVAFIRYDLPWESPYADAAGSSVLLAAPEPRVREVRMNFGTNSWNLRKAALDMTVADACVVDIGRPENEILAGMKPKTRYNIRLAKRKEVVVEPASEEMLPAFYDLYCQTARRNGFVICQYHYFSALFSEWLSAPDTSGVLFLLARRGRDLLAGGIIAITGKTAHYLFGASSRDNKDLMGSYALHWEAIRRARAMGCNRYDMGAVAPANDTEHPFYGLFRFKAGFGGRIVHRNGSWDYPIDHQAYMTFRNSEILSREMTI